MIMPNFLIIGAQRSGTSSLYKYLKQHPQIYMSPVKEPGFFMFNGEEQDFHGSRDREASIARYQAIRNVSITNIKDYCALFKGVTNQKAIGEASTQYLYSLIAPEHIHHYIPDAKLIAILRDPVERAYSNFFLYIQQGDKQFVTDFTRAVQEEEINVDDNWSGGIHYVRKGFYYTQLMRYFNTFNHNQIRVYLYEDQINDPIGFLQDIFCFLGVDDKFVPDISKKFNESAYYINKKASPNLFLTGKSPITLCKFFLTKRIRQKIKTCINLRNENFVKPPLLPEVRRQLIQIFREDILKLQDLIQRDLSKWLEI